VELTVKKTGTFDIEIELAKLGINRSQARIYLTLLKMHRTNASKLWEHSGVARQDVYRILKELYQRGLVEVIVGVPTEYKAVPIEDAVALLTKNRKKEVENELQVMNKTGKRLVAILDAKNNHQLVKERSEISLIPRKLALGRITNEFKNATRSISILTSQKRILQIINSVFKDYDDALNQGVISRVITDIDDKEKPLPNFFKGLIANPRLKVRYVAAPISYGVTIIDNAKALCPVDYHATTDVSSSDYLMITDKGIVASFADLYEQKWKTALEHKLEWKGKAFPSKVFEKVSLN
jgi:sugar-specific transcriptional regulator TrmB